MSEPIKTEAQQAFYQRARKGVLKFIIDRGGNTPLSDMHHYSESKFFIGHQNFSKMMESFVAEKLVDFDSANHTASITLAGKTFALAV